MKNKEEHEIFHWFSELCEYGLLTKKESQEPIAWYGIECGCGWYQIIRDVIDMIDSYCREHKIIDGVRVVQIKEKFGGLRIYINYDERINMKDCTAIESIIDDGVIRASKVCEVCGRLAKLRRGGYLQVLCWLCNFKKWYNRVFSVIK